MDPLAAFSTHATSPSQLAETTQVLNSAGGCSFEIDDVARLRRFLVLGTDGATYYASAKQLTRDNAETIVQMANTNHRLLVETIVSISEGGRAPRQNPVLFALALAASIGTGEERAAALGALHRVARTGTHLFLFARYVEQFRGWGRALRRAVADWYLRPEVGALAYQAVKYRKREGWSHRDLLRLSHPVTTESARRALFDWIVRGSLGAATPVLIEGFLKAQEPGADVPALIREHRLSWEMLTDEALSQRKVWDALLDVGIPQTALLRQLPRLTRLGMLPQLGGRTDEVAAQLVDVERLSKARVHPIGVLLAARTYASGSSARGESMWTPTTKITDSLDEAFYRAFGVVEPAGKRTMLALDVSGSMTAPISNMPLSCREASAALALVTAATEPEHVVVGFTGEDDGNGEWVRRTSAVTELPVSPRQRLDDVIATVSDLPFGGTNCALPMRYALEKGLLIDTFVIYTDNETQNEGARPHQALTRYRQATEIDARLIVVGMTATGFSIADPNDPGMLDIAGFDSAVPQVITDFSRGL